MYVCVFSLSDRDNKAYCNGQPEVEGVSPVAQSTVEVSSL